MSALPACFPSAAANAGGLSALSMPRHVAQAVWRGDELGVRQTDCCPTGWPALDVELPGGGWPRQAVVEVLATQPAVFEWRLLGPTLLRTAESGGQVVVVGPPRHPHLPGLQHIGVREGQFVWIQAAAPAERLWTTEQLIKSNAAGVVIAWLPQARPEQLRRLQVCALACDTLVFLCRPEAARHESSAAPLRVQAAVGADWELTVQILKRRGPAHDVPLVLPSVPGGLASVLTPRTRQPSRMISSQEAADAVGRTAVRDRPRRHATVG